MSRLFITLAFVSIVASMPMIAKGNFSIDRTTPSNRNYPPFLLKKVDGWMKKNGFAPKLTPDESAVYEAFLSTPPSLASKIAKGSLQNFQYGITFFDNHWAVGPIRLWSIDTKSALHEKFVALVKKKKITLSQEWLDHLVGVGFVDHPDKVELMFENFEAARAKLKTDFPRLEKSNLDNAQFLITSFDKGKWVAASALELAVGEIAGSRCAGSLVVSQVNRVSESNGAISFENYTSSFQEQALNRIGLLVGVKIQAGLNLGPGMIVCPKGSYTLVYP